ncbi:unnamed protein product [Victoria cruziana]
MDPCRFVRITVSGLAVKMPATLRPSRSGVHPAAAPPCYCEIRLRGLPTQTATVPLVSPDTPPPDTGVVSAGFHFEEADLRRLAGRGWLRSSGSAWLRISLFTGRSSGTCGGPGTGKLVGHTWVEMELEGVGERARVFKSGWAKIGKGGKAAAEGNEEDEEELAHLHLVVRAEPDPRFVFQFGGEPECNPVVFQIQGNIRQPVFSCKFSADRNSRSRSLRSDPGSSRLWSIRSFGSERERTGKERKGWMIVIHDLSGSPVAAASMVTPFVASPGSDRVSRLNPGAWLILRPNGYAGEGWKPWGRLEAWRERGSSEALGYRFELNSGTVVAESSISTKKGGRFLIDTTAVGGDRYVHSPVSSPRCNGESTASSCKGFVMISTVEGEGKCSKPHVQVGLKHVKCIADAAVFVALSAAIDLSMDACRLFSHKLRKELRNGQHESSF